ncbi:MAG: peptidoglycan-binding domain-containing protein [Verrucomicrobiota bacterium]
MSSKKLFVLTSAAICVLAAPIAMAAGKGQSSVSFAAPRTNVSASRPSFTAPRSSFAVSKSNFAAPRSGFAPSRTNLAQQARPQFSQRSGATAGNWNGTGHNRWHHRHHHHRFHNVYFADFGFPYYGYGWGYPYGYGYGYYPYDSGYYSYDDGAQVYDGGLDVSLVLQVQRRLARAGYYRGAIDGVIGGGTRSAIRAYERSHRLPVDGVIDDNLLARMGLS